MTNESRLVCVLMALFSLVIGTWCGAVGVMMQTYQECSTVGTKTYENFILKHPLTIKCSTPLAANPSTGK